MQMLLIVLFTCLSNAYILNVCLDFIDRIRGINFEVLNFLGEKNNSIAAEMSSDH